MRAEGPRGGVPALRSTQLARTTLRMWPWLSLRSKLQCRAQVCAYIRTQLLPSQTRHAAVSGPSAQVDSRCRLWRQQRQQQRCHSAAGLVHTLAGSQLALSWAYCACASSLVLFMRRSCQLFCCQCDVSNGVQTLAYELRRSSSAHGQGPVPSYMSHLASTKLACKSVRVTACKTLSNSAPCA